MPKIKLCARALAFSFILFTLREGKIFAAEIFLNNPIKPIPITYFYTN
ncbi:MAG: hypothetical protein ACYDEC_17845 [Bacteroidia bacterium]